MLTRTRSTPRPGHRLRGELLPVAVRALALASVLCLCLAGAAGADSFERYYLASQYDWPQSQGFSIDIEGVSLHGLTFFLTVAGDTRPARPSLQFDREYHLRAVIGPDGGRLSLDGMILAETPAPWRPGSGPLFVAYRPAWSSSGGDWLCEITNLTLTLARDGTAGWHRGPADGLSVPAQLFTPPALMSPEALPPEIQAALRDLFQPGLPFDPARASDADHGVLLSLLAPLLPFDPLSAARLVVVRVGIRLRKLACRFPRSGPSLVSPRALL